MHMYDVKYEYQIKINFKDSNDNVGHSMGKMFGDNESELNAQAKAILTDKESVEAMGLSTDRDYELVSVEILSRKEQV